MEKFATWLSGRKTYILALVIILLVLVLVFLGELTPQVAMTVLLVSIGGFAATFRSALAAHQETEMILLTQILVSGRAVVAHDGKTAASAGLAAAETAVELASELKGGAI